MDRALAPLFVKAAGLIPARVTPNQVTLASGTCGLAAGLVLMLWRRPEAYWLVAVLILAYSFLDNMDGVHARRTGRSSRLGGFFDHALDHAITPLIYLAFVLRFDLAHPLFITVVYLRSIANGIAANSEVATGKLFIPAIGPTVESYLTVLMLLSFYFWPGAAGHGPDFYTLNLEWLGFSAQNALLPITPLVAFFLISFFGNLMAIHDIVRFTIKNREA